MSCGRWLMFLCFAAVAAPFTAADEQVFSGPQAGEKLLPFRVLGVFDKQAGTELDFVTTAGDHPVVLIFVHDLNRQSVAFTRILSHYTHKRAADGVSTGIVWMSDDTTEAEQTLHRIRHALTPDVPVGISLDGREGPGSYGLNRKVTLTILVGSKGRVTRNFALIQPSLQVDLPKVLSAIVEVAGGKVPRLEDLEGMPAMARTDAAENAPRPAVMAELRPLLQPVIRKDASPEDVDRAAKAVEEFVAQNAAARSEVGRITNTIIDGGKLQNYGTARAQEYLQKWAKAYGKPAGTPPKSPEPPAEAPEKKEQR